MAIAVPVYAQNIFDANASNVGTPPPEPEEEINSILFSDEQIAAINKARQLYESKGKPGIIGINEEDFLEKLTKISGSPSEYTYPQFFLSSIIYRSPSDWIIWVNNTKMTQDDTVINGIDLRVLSVDGKAAFFEWRPRKTDKVNLDAPTPADGSIKTDFISGKVIFELHVNQTFSSYSMSILEGRAQPVTITTK